MLIDWLAIAVYLGLLLSWVPAVWATGLLELGVFGVSGTLIARQIAVRTPFRFSLDLVLLAAVVSVGPLEILARTTANPFETWGASLYWLTMALVYFVAKTLLTRAEVRSRFLGVQVWVGSALAIGSVILKVVSPLKVFGIFPVKYVSFGPFIYKNHYAAFLELIIPIAFYYMCVDARRRLLYGGLFAALFACVIASLSRAGVAIAICEVIVLIFSIWIQGLVPARTLRNIALPVILLMLVFTAMIGWEDLWGRFQESGVSDVRWKLAASTIDMIKAHPIVGYGLGTWRTVYPQFANFDIARVANEAHDDWLQWASEGGVAFAVALLCFAVYVSRYAWKHVWAWGVPAVFIHAALDYPTRNYGVSALLFLLAGALAAAGSGKQERDGPAGEKLEWQVLSVRTSRG